MKWVDYDALCAIPEKLRNYRRDKLSGNRFRLALATRDQLLMDMLTMLAWRPRHIRECRLKPRRVANLFKVGIPKNGPIANRRPIKEASRISPQLKFWQIRFRPEETKTGRPVRFLAPSQLTTLLEEYIDHHRPLLFKGKDPGTLFLNSSGRPLTSYSLRYLVENLTARFAGRRVNPLSFRHAIAVKWLEDNTNNYMTPSKMLWHADIRTVLKTYGVQFDEPRAARRLNKWLARNRKDKKTKGR